MAHLPPGPRARGHRPPPPARPVRRAAPRRPAPVRRAPRQLHLGTWFIIACIALVALGTQLPQAHDHGYMYHTPGPPQTVTENFSGPNAEVIACYKYYPLNQPDQWSSCNRDGSISGTITDKTVKLVHRHKVTIITARQDMTIKLDFLPADPRKTSADLPKHTPITESYGKLLVVHNGDDPGKGTFIQDSPYCPDVDQYGGTAPQTSMPVFCVQTDHDQDLTVELVCTHQVVGSAFCGAANVAAANPPVVIASWRVWVRVRYPSHP